ncbi:MAG: riboflavin synthase [Eubacterium sp.]|nr:riboflavin synthase [Eubacterium sp.]
MFTGIIEEIGIVKSIKKDNKSAEIYISANKIMDDIHLGDSIAVNGVCLTARNIMKDGFVADVMAETLRSSSLGELRTGSRVNLERAMQMNGRFGGHIVSGHIDGTGVITEKKPEANAIWVSVKTDPSILKFIIEKGSIAIDGISLTVHYVDDKIFKVSIIPHTQEETTLTWKNEGDIVNLENDIVGKYINRFISFEDSNKYNTSRKGLDMNTLLENGFL